MMNFLNIKKYKLQILAVISLMFIFSCKKEQIKNGIVSIKKDTLTEIQKEEKPQKDFSKYGFANTGQRLNDFENKDYEIQYAAEGDLNGDQISDAALVLKKKSDSLSPRLLLVLLKDKNKTYHLDQYSDLAIPAEYNEYEFKNYDTEDISINNGSLAASFYGIGASGNLSFSFTYLNSKLVLTNIESYAAGAGSQQNLEYQPLKGILLQSVTNTMEEEMPTKTKKINLKPQKYLFETTNPDEILSKIYNENNQLLDT